MILMIDNYDSFTYNLVQYLGQLGQSLKVFRNDKISVEEVKALRPERIVISPGPGRPEDAGISRDVIKECAGSIPLLGVCLGHQCIAEVFGAHVVRAKRLMHGKTSLIYHKNDALFEGIASPFEATRYHSLLVAPDSVGSSLRVIAKTKQGEIMALAHRRFPLWGVQFHPESILSTDGMQLLRNFIAL